AFAKHARAAFAAPVCARALHANTGYTGAALAGVEAEDAALARGLRSPEHAVVLLTFRAHAIGGPAAPGDSNSIPANAQHAVAGVICPIHTALAKNERLADDAVVAATRADHTAAIAALPAHAIAGGAAAKYGVGGVATPHHRNAIGADTSNPETIG